MKGIIPVNFLIMANTIKYDSKEDLKTYDLKGSTVNRIVQKGENQTLKDLNLLNAKIFKLEQDIRGFLQFKEEDIRKLNKIIQKDMTFFSKLNLIDYSVLLGIEKLKPNNKEDDSLK
jgi:hypothetical protein